MIPVSRRRLAALGLDGLSLHLARRLAAMPGFPGLARLTRDAVSVDAELPELSPVNWSSFATGEGPGSHGVFGFSRIHPGTYRLAVAHFGQLACPTIFDRLGERGLSSTVLNLPGTYPARPIPGTLVSGFVALDLDKAVHPPELAAKLRGIDYLLEADTTKGASEPHALLDGLLAALDGRERALELLWKPEAFDLFVFVVTETDRLFHFLYDAIDDEAHPLHGRCLEVLRRVDRLVVRFLELYDGLPQPRRLVALADHGFTRTRYEVDINAWLSENGFLSLDRPPENEWDAGCMALGSRAFALDPGRIYVHARSRFPRGPLDEAGAKRVKHEVRAGLLALEFAGERVMEAVHDGKELYAGPVANRGPDLVCQAREGFDLKAKWDRTGVFSPPDVYGRTGAHTATGAIFYDSDGSRPRRIRDVGRTILDHFDIA
jgi:predicted AlkP superfamily phosphohydrolase/phosphomutase